MLTMYLLHAVLAAAVSAGLILVLSGAKRFLLRLSAKLR